ncbi:MAG: hypothetical protein ACR2N7_09195 [Acidimicrobiia bacterium]
MTSKPEVSRELSLFATLRALELPAGDFAVFGSGPLIVRGIVVATNDLDIVCRGPAWDKACDLGEVVTLVHHDVDVVSTLDGDITVGTSWAYGDVDIDELIDSAEVINGLPFARLEHVVAYKTIANRPKDREHLRLLADSGMFSD